MTSLVHSHIHSGMQFTADQKRAFIRDGLWGKARSKMWQPEKCTNSIKQVTTRHRQCLCYEATQGCNKFCIAIYGFKTDAFRKAYDLKSFFKKSNLTIGKKRARGAPITCLALKANFRSKSRFFISVTDVRKKNQVQNLNDLTPGDHSRHWNNTKYPYFRFRGTVYFKSYSSSIRSCLILLLGKTIKKLCCIWSLQSAI